MTVLLAQSSYVICPCSILTHPRPLLLRCCFAWAWCVLAVVRSARAHACVHHLLYVSRSFVCACCLCVYFVYYHLIHQYHHLLNHPGLFHVAYVVFLFCVFFVQYLLLLLAAQRMMLLKAGCLHLSPVLHCRSRCEQKSKSACAQKHGAADGQFWNTGLISEEPSSRSSRI